MKKDQSNNKFVWWVLLAFFAVLLSYMFVVCYYYFIEPCNINAKLIVWPFHSTEQIGDFCSDSVVQINFDVKLSDLDEEDVNNTQTVSVLGVNVRQDGYIVAPYNKFRACDSSTEIKVNTKAGTVFNGKILFSDINFNIVVIKCESITENKSISIPYVNVGSLISADSVVAVSDSKVKGSVLDEGLFPVYNTFEYEGEDSENNGFMAVDFVIENCASVQINAAMDSACIFNKSGYLVGFAFALLSEDNEYAVMPVDLVPYVLKDIVSAYKNDKEFSNQLVDSFIGLDFVDVSCHTEVSDNPNINGNQSKLFFDGKWINYSDTELGRFMSLQTDDGNKFYYLMKDFEFGDVRIEKDCYITSITFSGGKKHNVSDKARLFKLLYNFKGGEVKIAYRNFVDEEEHFAVVEI